MEGNKSKPPKRRHDDMEDGGEQMQVNNDTTLVFESFRSELDAHQDRRERIVKASRDITAASKKVIFALQRVRTLNKPLSPAIMKATSTHYQTIGERLSTIAGDLQSTNAFRYFSTISPGLQELMEAILFEHYLEKQSLLSFPQANERLHSLIIGDLKFDLQPEDYVLGVYDMTGELMRFLINAIATSGGLPTGNEDALMSTETSRSALHDLRQIRFHLELLDPGVGSGFLAKNARSKLVVTQASVEKVEKALYNIRVRGSERPKGWLPDLSEKPPSLITVADNE